MLLHQSPRKGVRCPVDWTASATRRTIRPSADLRPGGFQLPPSAHSLRDAVGCEVGKPRNGGIHLVLLRDEAPGSRFTPGRGRAAGQEHRRMGRADLPSIGSRRCPRILSTVKPGSSG